MDVQHMTLRDYFAGQYLAGYSSCSDNNIGLKRAAEQLCMSNEDTLSKLSYKYADAMMRARQE